ncbi:MAG: ATP-binding protein [Bacteroidota bacterium]
MSSESSDVLPLLAPELLYATCAPDGERLHCNTAWGSILGTEGLWEAMSDEDARFAAEYLSEAAAGGLVTNQVFLVDRHKRDLPVPVLLNFLPIFLPDQQAGSLKVMVTGEVLQEPVSWATEQTRRRRMEMLGQMAMGIAHDFNNLLTSILGHTELLRGDLTRLFGGHGSLATDAVGQLKTIERAALDGAVLVKKIQQYIRHEKQERFERIDLSELIEEVLALTRPYWYNEPRRQGILIRTRKQLAELPKISGSGTELREVFANLILNAVQAMPHGGTITVRTHVDEARGVVAEVRDNGLGMPEDVRSRIFEPLFTTKGDRGTGMGLTVSYGIVQEHEGTIEVTSQAGEGTRFTLTFPILTDVPAEPRPVLPEPEVDVEDARVGHLLVVDDEEMVRSVTGRLLRLKGHEVDEAEGGERALARIADHPYDLVLTDLSMPDMNGRELAFRIRQHHPRLPIILLTGDTDADDGSEHIDVVVKKPFKLDDLEAVVQRLLTN